MSDYPLNPPILPGTVDIKDVNPGAVPLDAFEQNGPDEEPRILRLRSGWGWRVGGQGAPVMDHLLNKDEEIPPSCELFELNTPDLVSSSGRTPLSGAVFNHFPARLSLDNVPTYDNLWSKWAAYGTIGVFKATTNLVASPEDMTVTWANSGSTDALSSLYFQGQRFTQILGNNTATNAGVTQAITVLAAVTAFQFKFKKGYATSADNATYTQVTFVDSGVTARLSILIYWDKVTVTETTGSVVSCKWYGDVCEVLLVSTACAAGAGTLSIHAVRRAAGNIATTEYGYLTAVQVENSTYPTPYTPTSRAVGGLAYSYSWPRQFKAEFWVGPWFILGAVHWYLSDDDGVTNPKVAFFFGSDNRMHFRITDGAGNYVGVKSNSDYLLSDLRNQIHYIVYADLDAKTVGLKENGAAQNTGDSNGVVGTITPNDRLRLGIVAAGYEPDAFITDLLIWPTADVSTTHYDSTRPYYDSQRLLGENSAWRLP